MQNMRYAANGIPQRERSPVKSGGNNGDLSRIKVVVVGDGGTGKTSLLVVFTDGEFPEVDLRFFLFTYKISIYLVWFLWWSTALVIYTR